MQPKISVIIVTYQVQAYLAQCLNSLEAACQGLAAEVVIVDNASNDGTAEFVAQSYPKIPLIRNSDNVGFGRACNQGVRRTTGEYVLFLNPDTMVQNSSLAELASFLDHHPDAGIVGPRILGPDGRLQLACRRSFPTPAAALFRLLGLSRLFPRSRRLGRYNLTFLDPEIESEVDAVSGSCMMVRRSALDRIGGFDEEFFLYGEDLDLCHRVRTAGWKIMYTPATQIVHFKGQSARHNPLRTRLAFYNAMFLFSRKHVAARHSFLPRWILYAGIALNAAAGLLRLPGRHLPSAVLDLALLNALLFGFLELWFRHVGLVSPYVAPNRYLGAAHLTFSLVWLGCLGVGGAYGSRRQWVLRSFRAGMIASLLTLTTVYLFRQFAFSRAAFTLTSLFSVAALPGWRWLVDRAGAKGLLAPEHHVLVVGDSAQVALAIQSLRGPAHLRISYLAPEADCHVFAEHLGAASAIQDILRARRIDELICFENAVPYTQIIEIIAAKHKVRPLIRLASKSPDGRLLMAELGQTAE